MSVGSGIEAPNNFLDGPNFLHIRIICTLLLSLLSLLLYNVFSLIIYFCFRTSQHRVLVSFKFW